MKEINQSTGWNLGWASMRNDKCFCMNKEEIKRGKTDGANVCQVCYINKRKWSTNTLDLISAFWLEVDLDNIGLDTYLARKRS